MGYRDITELKLIWTETIHIILRSFYGQAWPRAYTTQWNFKRKKGLKNSIKTHKRARLAWKSSVTLSLFSKDKVLTSLSSRRFFRMSFWEIKMWIEKSYVCVLWKWSNENAVQQQFTGYKSVWVLSKVHFYTV